ncbi:GNAT family acetyltransferase [Nocardioides sp. Soil797]|nr:GNAT family acetyltransferase [Nocardioides sp. Soil797]
MSHWPVTLQHAEVTLRPIEQADAHDWREVRARNADWLKPWDATVPPGAQGRPATFRGMVKRLTKLARVDEAMPFVVEVDGRLVGQVTVSNIVRGSGQFASIGYWIDQRVAGRGVMPLAVAMAIDYCFLVAGLHRIEISIRPENTNSLRVVEKLDIREVGYAPKFLHIDGEWRDHRQFAITAEECPGGLVKRLEA